MNNSISPELVEAYQEAFAAGLLPHAPSDPPRPVTLNSTKVLLLCIAAFFITGILGIKISNMPASPTWLDVSIFILPVLSALAAGYFPGKAKDKEFAAGYTYFDTAVMTYGIPLSKLFKVQNQAGPAGYNWNLRGLWKLNNDGSVNRAPVEGVLPIGYYPSPSKQGEFEYWTGADWMGKYLQRSDIPQGGKLIP